MQHIQPQQLKQLLIDFIDIILKGEEYTPQKHMEMYSHCVTYCQLSTGNSLELYKTIQTKYYNIN